LVSILFRFLSSGAGTPRTFEAVIVNIETAFYYVNFLALRWETIVIREEGKMLFSDKLILLVRDLHTDNLICPPHGSLSVYGKTTGAWIS